MFNGYILVEQMDKVKKKSDSSPFTRPVINTNLGTVKYSSDDGCPIGMEVYFGGKYEKINVDGVEVLAMKFDNIIAKVMETSNGDPR